MLLNKIFNLLNSFLEVKLKEREGGIIGLGASGVAYV